MDENQKHIETVNDVLLKTFKAIANKDTGCIIYVFDRSENGGGTGFNSRNCDAGDAMVAIKRIAAQFGIDFELLAEDI